MKKRGKNLTMKLDKLTNKQTNKQTTPHLHVGIEGIEQEGYFVWGEFRKELGDVRERRRHPPSLQRKNERTRFKIMPTFNSITHSPLPCTP